MMKTSQELEILSTGVARLLAKGEKINAIERVQEKTDYGLKESKDFVDSANWSTPKARNRNAGAVPSGPR